MNKERNAYLSDTRNKCRFAMRKELTFSAFAIIAFAVTYQETSSIPYLSSIVVYSFLASGVFSIMLLQAWERQLTLILARTDINIPTPKEKNIRRNIKRYIFLYKFLYVVGVISAVIMYATS